MAKDIPANADADLEVERLESSVISAWPRV